MRAAPLFALLALSFLGCGVAEAIGDAGSAGDGGLDPMLDAALDGGPLELDAGGPVLDGGPPPADWLSTGSVASCASREGRVWCWGRPWTGSVTPAPIEIAELAGARQLSITSTHACAVMGDRRVACAGSNRTGQLGVDPRALERRDTFAAVPGVEDAVEVAVGTSFACALIDDGSVRCWGDYFVGQTGSPIPRHSAGSAAPQPTPAAVEGIAGAIAIAAGQYHACAVLESGSVRCWGYDWFGALGRGAGYTGTPQYVAGDVEGVTDARDVAIDSNSSCALRADGTVACWGAQAQLYPGYDAATADECSVVVSQICWRAARTLPGIEGASSLGFGGGTGCVATADAWQCWGTDGYGQATGDGAALAPIAELAVGNGHVCVRDLAGAISCRGRGEEGQLGNGESASSRSLVQPTLP